MSQKRGLGNLSRKWGLVEKRVRSIHSLKAYNFIKKRLQRKCFPVNIAEFMRSAFFIEHFWWLLLKSGRKLEEVEKETILAFILKEAYNFG